MKFIKVHNITNKELETKEAWEESKQEKATLCCCKCCIKKASIISKVKRSGKEEGKKVYNIPVCNECGNKKEDYYVDIDELAI